MMPTRSMQQHFVYLFCFQAVMQVNSQEKRVSAGKMASTDFAEECKITT